MIPYRAFGWLQLIVAVIILAEGGRQKGHVWACLVASGVFLIDLPLRWLGNVVPWREYDVDDWVVSRYRGSHIAYVPAWLFGVPLLLLGGGLYLRERGPALAGLGTKDGKPGGNGLAAEGPPGKLDVAVRHGRWPPFYNFQVTVTNREADKVNVGVDVYYEPSPRRTPDTMLGQGGLGPGETATFELFKEPRPGRVRVETFVTGPDQVRRHGPGAVWEKGKE
jgi:hypothetical protein